MTRKHLHINDIWHCYGNPLNNTWSLKSFDLDLYQGELLGLLGPSGCGKTTLLRLIAGFEKPVKGSVFLNDIEVSTSSSLVPPEKRGVGMVFQDYALFPHLDAWQNTCFGLKRGQDKSRALWLLELLGLADLRYRYPHELSGGQRQRLALARALAPGTSLVLLDEAFSSLDVEVRDRLRSELSSVLKTCGASGILVTHDPNEALAICDRVAVIKGGELHQCSSPCDLVENPATSFVGRFVLQRNILPVQSNGCSYSTPIGDVSKLNDSSSNIFTELMVDEQAIQLEKDPAGIGQIQCREFLGSQWMLKVQYGDLILHVKHSLDLPFNTGDRCCVNFRNGKKGILFPGGIHCKL